MIFSHLKAVYKQTLSSFGFGDGTWSPITCNEYGALNTIPVGTSGLAGNTATISASGAVSLPNVGLITVAAMYGDDVDTTGLRLVSVSATDVYATDGLPDLLGAYAGINIALTSVYNATDGSYYAVQDGNDNADNLAPLASGLIPVVSRLQGFDGTNYDRYRIVGDNSDARATAATGHFPCFSHLAAFNGTTWDRVRTNAAAVVSGTTQPFAVQVAEPGEWSVTHTPAANTQATISKAAGAAGVRHVCRSISATLTGLTAAAEAVVQVNVRDGATGAGTILWSQTLMVIPGGVCGVSLSGLNIVGSAATAMTIEFSAAGGASTSESVAMTGYSTV